MSLPPTAVSLLVESWCCSENHWFVKAGSWWRTDQQPVLGRAAKGEGAEQAKNQSLLETLERKILLVGMGGTYQCFDPSDLKNGLILQIFVGYMDSLPNTHTHACLVYCHLAAHKSVLVKTSGKFLQAWGSSNLGELDLLLSSLHVAIQDGGAAALGDEKWRHGRSGC